MVVENLIFSEQDCEFIKSFYDTSVEKNEVGFKIETKQYPQGVNIKDGSVATWNEIQNERLNRFLLEHLGQLGITSLPILKLVKYQIGSKMVPHRDFQLYGSNPIYRSATVQLSNPDDYKGGQLYVEGNKATDLQGTVVMFNPNQEHWVTEITLGERWVIVAFLQEKHFDSTKSII